MGNMKYLREKVWRQKRRKQVTNTEAIKTDHGAACSTEKPQVIIIASD